MIIELINRQASINKPLDKDKLKLWKMMLMKMKNQQIYQ